MQNRTRHIAFIITAVLALALEGRTLQAGEISASGPTPSTLDDDGMLVVHGKRTFIFGCYWNPGTTEGLAQLHAAGFNLVSAGADRAALDAVARQGLLAWIPLGGLLAPSNEAEAKALEAAIAPLRDHPALAVWEIPDEALWNEWWNRTNALAAEREKLAALLREREQAGADLGRVRELLAREAAVRARADFAAAEALEREVRSLVGAPEQNAAIQVSRAPASAEAMRQRLLRGRRVVRHIDGRPIWMNYAPRNTPADIARYAEAADIVGCDIYPVPAHPSQGHSDLANKQPSSVGDYTERFRLAGKGRPVWMVLQGFGWRDLHGAPPDAKPEQGRRPTREESRFMLFDAIVHGARGALYWGVNYAQAPPEFWTELRAVVREAADWQAVWAARDADAQPRVEVEPTWGSLDRPPLALAKRGEDKKTFVLVVNEEDEGLGVRLSGLEPLGPAAAALVYNPSGCALKEERLREGALVVYMPAQAVALVRIESRITNYE